MIAHNRAQPEAKPLKAKAAVIPAGKTRKDIEASVSLPALATV